MTLKLAKPTTAKLALAKPTTAKLTLAKSFTWNETAWNPSMIQTALWLDAADASTVTSVSGAVSQWNDKSGNARHATQSTAGSRPTYSTAVVNNRNVIAFDGSSDALVLPTGFTLSAFACFAVFEPSAKANSYVYYITPSNTNFQLSLISRYVTPGNYEFYQGNAPGRRVISESATGQNIVYYERNGTSVVPRFNGGVAISAATVDGANTVVATHLVGATSPTGSTGENYQGNLCELILIPSIPSTLDRQRIEGYLAHKWGLTTNLPSDHPYKTVGPTP